MLKVYLKGFDRPYAVFGEKVFEDERFFVIQTNTVRADILWENILYIERIIDVPEMQAPETQPSPQLSPSVKPPTKEQLLAKLSEASERIKSGELGSDSPRQMISVCFDGIASQTFGVEIPTHLVGKPYSPQLSKEIFSNPQIKSFFTGGFIMDGTPQVEGENVFIKTVALNNKMGIVKDKLEVTQNFLTSVANSAGQKFVPPKVSSDNTFSMPGSPFTDMMSLQDTSDAG